MAEEVERIFVIPLKKRNFKSSKAANTAVKRVKDYITRHMKVSEDDVWIDSSLNEALWSFGKYKIPRKIRVKAVKFEDGVVEAYLPELEFKKSIRELLKEEREKKEPVLRKEAKAAEAPVIPGAEEYKIAPTGEGEVKIKKKKAPKKKAEKEPTKEKINVKKEKGTEKKKTKSKKTSKEDKPKKTKKQTRKKSEGSEHRL